MARLSNSFIGKSLCALSVLAMTACGTPRNVAGHASDTGRGGRLSFGLNLFTEALRESHSESENVVVSPYSAGVALSMLAGGAAGETEKELSEALSHASYAGDCLVSSKNATVSSANSLWIKKGFSVKPEYKSMLSDSYGARISERDFSDRSTVREINGWCSEKTSGKIPQIVDELSPDMVMLLVNALYFKSSWEYEFAKENTYDEVFHSPSGDSKVPFMHLTRKFQYGETGGSRYVVLPYKSDEYRMVICLPAEGRTTSEVLSSADTAAFKGAVTGGAETKVALSLPKFKVNTALTLNRILASMGVRKAFSQGADFSGITGSSVAVDEVRQKCFVEVDEEGAEAAAVTSIGIRLTSAMPEDRPVNMRVNRPFIFAIVDSAGSDILFIGRIGKIEK